MISNKFLLLVVALFIASAFAAIPPGVAKVPVTGNYALNSGSTGKFTGQFQIQQLVVLDEGGYGLKGLLSGSLAGATGKAKSIKNELVTIPLLSGTAGAAAKSGKRSLLQLPQSCEILDLQTGPIEIDLLGLVITLDPIHLNITAQSGPGNLLGNLLCAIVGLLDPQNNPLQTLIDLINQILGGILGGL